MKHQSKLFLLVVTIVCSVFLLGFSRPAYAATDSAATLQDLQAKLNSALLTRASTYSIVYSGSSTVQADVSTAINNIFAVDDYLHYDFKGYQYSYTTGVGVANITFNFSYWDSATQQDYVNTRVTQILGQIISPDMNDYQKEKAVHDWIEANVAYDTSLVQHSAYAALVSPYKTVCQGYSLLTYKMLNQAGVQTRIVAGTAGGQAHAWNAVYLDGAWYMLDTTWDDPVPDVAGRIVYNYYNLTNSQLQVDHTWTQLAYPMANTDFATTLNAKTTSDPSNASVYQAISDALSLQYLLPQNTASNATELNAKIQQAIQNNLNKITVRYTNKATVASDIQTAIKGISNITSYQYSYSNYTRATTPGSILLNLQFNYSIPVSVTAVSLSQNSLDLKVGGPTVTLLPTVQPSNASNKTVLWSTSNPSIATVNNGIVKAVGGGNATITATTADGGFTATSTVNVVAPVTGVTLDKTTLTIKLGNPDVTINSIIAPVSATVKDVTWASSNPNVATVDQSGKVHAVSYGTATITVTTKDGAKTARCTVTVPTPVSGVTLNQNIPTLKVGYPYSLVPIFTPSNATNKAVIWTSSNTVVATVNEKGVVMPVIEGSATITATTLDGGFTANVTVNVIRGVTSVTLDKTSLSLKLGDPDITLNATVAPTNATIKGLVWKSSNPNVATVSQTGVVHAVTYGTVVISATSTQDITKQGKCTVTIPTPVAGVSLNQNVPTLKVGYPYTLVPIFTPSNATNKAVIWTSSNTGVATVSAKGIVSPLKEGTSTITVTTVDGGFTASLAVNVIQGVISITLDKTSASLKVGGPDITLNAMVAPTNATIKSLIWKSSNPNVATVSQTGVIHAVAYGTVVISATSTQDTSKVARCTVVVQQ